MKPRDIFRIIVATAGLYCLILGVARVIGGVVTAIATPSAGGGQLVAGGVIEMVAGVLIMKGHPPLTDLAFPPEQPKDKDDDDAA
jgi:hypothetical protein